ncbi:MAG: hypothetical protein K5989_12670 [Lachnospiraceae bacterium]|nr:hypothetical protein [Lachnospiraceae bacterium]
MEIESKSIGKRQGGALRAAVFVALLLVLLFGASALIRPKHGEVYNITEVQMKLDALRLERAQSMDIFFAGDSESYRTFSPLQLWKERGYTSYNLGASALRLCDAYEIFASALEYQSPKLVFLETDAILAEAGTHKDEDDLLTNRVEDLLPIFHYHIFYKSYLPESVRNQDIYWKDANILKGFLVQDMERPYGGGDYMAEDKRLTPIPEANRVFLNNFKELCLEKGIQLVIVSAPSASTWHSGKHKAIAEWSEDNGVPYLDLNLLLSDMGIDWEHDTMDGGNHVNFAGAVKTTAYVGKYIEEQFELSDHREDPDFSDWDQKLKTAEAEFGLEFGHGGEASESARAMGGRDSGFLYRFNKSEEEEGRF